MNGTTMACVAAAAAAAATATGCIHVTTESEIKPIHITMDVNVKVDRELDKAFADENRPKPPRWHGNGARTARFPAALVAKHCHTCRSHTYRNCDRLRACQAARSRHHHLEHLTVSTNIM